MRRHLFAIAALGAMIAVPAAAETMAIQYKDLDLATEQGQKILDRRIDAAAREVCGFGEVTTGSRIGSPATRACYAEAKSKARERLAAIVAEQQLGG